MYCPRCAAQNLDDAKFCRVCGTNLETVALALADKYPPAKGESGDGKDPFESWLETRKKGVNGIVHGIGWFLSSLLIGIALGVFSNANDWVIIWMVMAGWMAVVGVISIFSGTARLMESRFLRDQLGPGSGAATPPVQQLTSGERATLNEASTKPILPQTSVTEHTTTRLIKPGPTTKEVS